MLASVYFTMVPRDFDPKNPDGTGPFKYQSFTPGVASTFVRNEHYWHSGLPHLDSIVTTNIADETSQVNALQSGQVDVINFLSEVSVAALQAGGMHVNISNTGGWGPFVMRTDQKPFDDVRVRQAFRLIVDRKEMLNQIFGGNSNRQRRVRAPDKGYPKDLPQREQDIDQAKSLLKAAGADSLTVDLVTTPNAPGMIQAAQVFATQAKKAGVNVNVVQQTTTGVLRQLVYLKVPFSQDYWQTGTYMFTAGQALAPGARSTSPCSTTPSTTRCIPRPWHNSTRVSAPT